MVATAESVVASVVAQRENDATTRRATTNRVPVVRATTERATTERATTERATTGLVWRIEINRRKKADGTYSYHWLYRFGSGKDRRAVYGGTVDRLMALNPTRWVNYVNNSED